MECEKTGWKISFCGKETQTLEENMEWLTTQRGFRVEGLGTCN
jgi:hypothetical protein